MKKLLAYFIYLKPVQGKLTLAILSGMIFGLTTGLGLPILVKVLYPIALSSKGLSTGTLALFLILPLVATIVRALFSFLNSYYIAYCGQFLLEKIRLMVFQRIQQMPLAFFNKYTPGELITRASSDTWTLQTSIVEFAENAVKQPITLIGTVGYLIYVCFQESSVAFLFLFLAAIPVCIIPIRMIGLKMRAKAFSMQNQAGAMTQRLNQNLSAIKEIRSFCMETGESKRYAVACKEYFLRAMKIVKYSIILSPIVEVIGAVGVIGAFYITYTQNIAPEIFLSSGLALYFSYEPIKKLGRLNSQMQQGLASLHRLDEIINQPISIADPENPVPVDKLKGNIEFSHVNFNYTDTPVLKDLTISLPAHKTYALVGSSGAGKTTFSNLIPRFYDTGTGTVSIDGINVRHMRQFDLRKNIATVSQDPTLFNDTIYNNILVGKPEATREEVIEAAKKAYAHDFIKELPKGYETDAGEDGALISGGQKQRIAIARAFLKDAPILILDEATSALDSVSERIIQKALENLIEGKTVVIIAHRFSSIKHADEILVFKEGEIIERGTHEELFTKQGEYHKLYQHQLQQVA